MIATGAVKSGAWAALGLAALGLVRLALGVAMSRSVVAGLAPSTPTVVLTAAVGVLTGGALLLAVRGAGAALSPRTALLRTVTLAGGLGGFATIVAAAAGAAQPGGGTLPLTASYLAVFAGGFWIAGVCAVDARLRRLPAWLRIVGVAAALCAMSAVVLDVLAILAVPLTLAWWVGLGLALLRLSRAPLPAVAEAG